MIDWMGDPLELLKLDREGRMANEKLRPKDLSNEELDELVDAADRLGGSDAVIDTVVGLADEACERADRGPSNVGCDHCCGSESDHEVGCVCEQA